MNEDELLERAKRAYCRSGALDEPGNCSEVIAGVFGNNWRVYVKLTNVNGVLAVYRYYPQYDKLKRLELRQTLDKARTYAVDGQVWTKVESLNC